MSESKRRAFGASEDASRGFSEGEPAVDAQTLRGLLAPHRPDPRAFRAGVERKLRERAGASGAQSAEPARASRVAALLPPQVAGALGVAGGGKGLTLGLALPALVVASTFGAFAAGAGALARATRGLPALEGRARLALDPRRGRSSALLLGVQVGSLAALLASGLFGSRLGLDVLCLALLAAQLALTASVRELGGAGLLTRAEVARACTGLLASVLGGVFLWRRAFGLHDDSDLGPAWPVVLVLAGLVACVAVARRQGPRARGGTGFVLAWAAFLVLLDPFGCTRSSPEALRASFPRLTSGAEELSGWKEAAATWEALRATGAAPPDTSALRAEVERAIEQGVDAHPQVWSAAARMELVDEAHWGLLAARAGEAYALERLVRSPRYDPTPYYGYRVPMLLAARPPTETERAALVAALTAVLDGEHEPLALRPALAAVRALEQLGRADLVAERGERLRALLVRHWIDARPLQLFARPGGFSAHPDTVTSSLPEATYEGLSLLARVGVPAPIDRVRMRGYLRNECVSVPLGLDPKPELHAFARAALLRLEREVGLPPRSFLERLLAERLLACSALLVALCLLALALAPVGEEPERAGALP